MDDLVWFGERRALPKAFRGRGLCTRSTRRPRPRRLLGIGCATVSSCLSSGSSPGLLRTRLELSTPLDDGIEICADSSFVGIFNTIVNVRY